MARTPRETTVTPLPDVNEEVLTGDLHAADVNVHRLMDIDVTYGDGLPYDRDRLVNEARFLMAQSAEAMLEAGKRLILLKEHEPHGEFTEIIENRLGMPTQVARRMMQASLKFLDSKRSTLSVLGKSKLYELMILDDDDLDALADGGTVAGMERDEIACMSVRELRAALHKAKEDAEIKERQLQAKDQKINDLDAKLSKPAKNEPEPWSAAEHMRALDSMVLGLCGKILSEFNGALNDLMHGRDISGLPRVERQAIAAALGRVRLAVTDVGERFGIAPNEADDASQGIDEIDAIWGRVNAEMDAQEGKANEGSSQ